jgi:drug/metabolite transporter (DMT)-like permease
MVLMIISSIVISFGGLIIRNMQSADALQINFYRALAFGLAISIIMLFRYGRTTPKHLIGIGKTGVLSGAMLAMSGIAFLQAITNTTVAATLFTLSAIPFLTAAMAWLFLGESIRKSTGMTMIAAAFGVLLMVIEGFGKGSLYGNAMALVCAFGFSSYATILRRNRGVEMMPALIVSSILIMAFVLFIRWGDMAIPLHDLALCFFLGGIISGFTNALFIISSRHLLAAELTIFMLLEFALGPIWVWLFVNEVPTRWTIVGGCVVISAVLLRALLELGRGSKPGRPTQSPRL